MSSKTAICNKALRRLSISQPILNVDTDDTTQSGILKASYDEVLESVLRMHNWNFATFRQSLNIDTSKVISYGYKNAYVLPTIPKFLKLTSIEGNEPFVIENNYILTDASSLKISFIGKVTDVNKYDSLFIDCFALKLAYEVGFALTENRALVGEIGEEFLQMLKASSSKDNQEKSLSSSEGMGISSFNQARTNGFNIQISATT
tara:strand:- start:7867 stop:8478 length:612 start_codon:yes stop_codon:yes gene_type:complete